MRNLYLKRIFIIVIALAMITSITQAMIATSTSFIVRQNILSTGGGNNTYSYSTSSTFMSAGALGQTAIGTSTSSSFHLLSGFLQSVATTTIAPALTFTVDSGTKAFGTVTPGIVTEQTSTLTITTTNSTGYSVTVARANGSATMLRTGDTSVSIPDKTAWSAPAATTTTGNSTASTTEPSTLQFRVRSSGTDTASYSSTWWGTTDADANALFAGFPSTNQKIINRSTAAPSNTNSVVLYNLKAPLTQKDGAYTGDITYITTANP